MKNTIYLKNFIKKYLMELRREPFIFCLSIKSLRINSNFTSLNIYDRLNFVLLVGSRPSHNHTPVHFRNSGFKEIVLPLMGHLEPPAFIIGKWPTGIKALSGYNLLKAGLPSGGFHLPIVQTICWPFVPQKDWPTGYSEL